MPVAITIEIRYCNECEMETKHIKESHAFPIKQIKYKCCKCKDKNEKQKYRT